MRIVCDAQLAVTACGDAEFDAAEWLPPPILRKLFMSGTGVVSTAKLNPSSHWKTRSIEKKIWNRCIRDGEGIKRILDWHADAERTKAYVGARNLERIRPKRYRC